MKKFVVLVISIILLSGCGTLSSIGHIGYEKVYISADQENAIVKINGRNTDVSKGYILIDKHIDGAFITYSKPDYKDSNLYLQREVNPIVIILDTLLIFPLIIDAINGELFNITPTNIKIFMTEEKI